MNTFEDVVKHLRKRPKDQLGFAIYEGKKGAPLGIIADKVKGGRSLSTPAKKKGKVLAFGSVHLVDGKEVVFSCDKCQAGFRMSALKPYFADFKEKAKIEQESNLEVDEGVEFSDAKDEAPPAPEKLVVLWSKAFEKPLKSTVAAQLVDRLDNIGDPVEGQLPALFIRTLKANNAAAFAQRLVDDLNAAFDEAVKAMADAIKAGQGSDESLQEADQIRIGFPATCEKVVDKYWAAFAKRYEVTKGFKVKRFKAFAVPVVGGLAAVGGLATSGGLPLAFVPASISLLRAGAAGFDAYLVYAQDLAAATGSLEKSTDRLKNDFLDVQGSVTKASKAGETARILINAITGTGFAGSLKSVRSDCQALDARLSLKEQGLDDILGLVNKTMQQIERNEKQLAYYQKKQGKSKSAAKKVVALEKKLASARAEVPKCLDSIGDTNRQLQPTRDKIGKARTVLDALDKSLDNPALTLEKVEQVMACLVDGVMFSVNLNIGIATASEAIGALSTTVGGLADLMDTYDDLGDLA